MEKTAIITGSAQRIGKAAAEALHAQGYNVLLHYRSTSTAPLEEQFNAERPGSCRSIRADLNDEGAPERICEAALNTFGRIDALINNASSFFPTPVGEATLRDWDDLINSNARAPFFLAQACARPLKASKGAIINIADIYAEQPKRDHTIYCMAKAANAMLTKSLAVELAPHVRVNGVAPGAALWPESGAPANEQASLKEIPLARIGGSAAIVDAILFLLRNSYVTGQIVAIDGGKSVAGIA